MVKKKTFLSPEDEALWKASQKDTKPLEGRPHVDLPKNKRVDIQPGDRREVKFTGSMDAPAQTKLTRKDIKKIAKGDIRVEGKLDLHGSTKDASYNKLLSFIEAGFAGRKKCLLVVTGKGGKRFSQTQAIPAASRKYEDFNHGTGILKNAVPEWLSGPPFSHFVASFREAHAAHGGEGAYYVMLRGKRDT